MFFTVFLKNKNFISKIRILKVSDYAALIFGCNLIRMIKVGEASTCYKHMHFYGASVYYFHQSQKKHTSI